jgi:hypothetical protein
MLQRKSSCLFEDAPSGARASRPLAEKAGGTPALRLSQNDGGLSQEALAAAMIVCHDDG